MSEPQPDLTEGGKKPWFRKERRSGRFTEKLSWFMAIVAAFGGAYVIIDPVITFNVSWGTVSIGGKGFAEQLKGAVVALILIEGWKAVKEFWLGASNQGMKAQDSVNTIAQAAAPATAAAVAAATGQPVQPNLPPAETTTDSMNVQADNVTVTETPQKPKE